MMKKMKGGKMKQMMNMLGGGGGMPALGDMNPNELAKIAKQLR